MSLERVLQREIDDFRSHPRFAADFAKALEAVRTHPRHPDATSGAHGDDLPAGTGGVPTKPKVAISSNFPDPSIIKGPDGQYYAFATGGNGYSLQMSTASSPDGRWSPPTGVPGIKLPSWAAGPHQGIWAPDVHEVGQGKDTKYIMYFSTNTHAGHQAIGVATGTLTKHKDGKWTWHWKVDDPKAPIISAYHGTNANPNAVGGAIDPSFFKDPATGHSYIVYKNDGNSEHQPDTIWIQRVDPSTGRPLPKTKPIPLLTNKRDDHNKNATVVEHGMRVEAPQIVRHGNEYVMFYSAGRYNDGSYTEYYATSKTLDGPWKPGGKLLSTGGDNHALLGPGGATVMGNVIVFHNISQLPDKAHHKSLVRQMMVAKLQWNGGAPFVEGGNPKPAAPVPGTR